MKCPHCLVDFHDAASHTLIGKDRDSHWALVSRVCAACGRFILHLENGEPEYEMTSSGRKFSRIQEPAVGRVLVRPRAISRSCPTEVPKKFADNYFEACVVFPDSAKAAAALGRRCLQDLLREEAKVKPGNLADEIQQVIDSGKLPVDLSDSIDAVRNIGNFAAHPLKSQQSGQILDVEPGEAEWTLDVLDSLFEFYFVRTAALQKRKTALNLKLKEAGKPPMK